MQLNQSLCPCSWQSRDLCRNCPQKKEEITDKVEDEEELKIKTPVTTNK